MTANLTRLIEFGLDLLGQDLTKLDSPLIERVDVPDGTFGESKMLVVHNQCAESGWCDLLCQNRSSGPVAEEGLVIYKVCCCSFGFDFLRRLADHQGFRLSEEIRCEHSGLSLVLLTQKGGRRGDLLLVLAVGYWVVALGSEDKVGWDQLGTLVEKLEE